MEGESCVNRSIIDDIESWDIQVDKTAGETGVTRSINDEVQPWDIEGDQIEG